MLQEEEQMLVNMKKILEIAEAEGYAIPCINTPNEETVRAVIGAAEELNTPIIIDHAQVHDSLNRENRADHVKICKRSKSTCLCSFRSW